MLALEATRRMAGAQMATMHVATAVIAPISTNVAGVSIPSAMLPMGYPRGSLGKTKRKPVEEVLYWDRWGKKSA